MSVHVSTYVARSPTRLLNRISTLTKKYEGHDLTLLFALSSNFPDTQDLGRAVDALVNLSRTRTVGCLSGNLGYTRINGRSVNANVVSLSVAVLDSAKVKPFRSTIPGREVAQVGRWHALRKKEEGVDKEYSLREGVSWEEVWKGGSPVTLPEELQSLDSSHIQGLVYFTDLKPEGLFSSFRNLPGVTKLGLFASSTPFITGRPVTLFHNQKIFSSGAVGLAITDVDLSNTNSKPAFEVDFLGVERISGPMTVTQREGNMVNALDGDNPTKLLISVIKKWRLDYHISGTFKEEEAFSLAALSGDGKIDRVYRITAGDPSRGGLSLDSPSAPAIGTRVQFIHIHSTAIPDLSIPSNSPKYRGLNFLTASEGSRHIAIHDPTMEDFEMLIENVFLASSENGFVFERAAFPAENVK